MKENLENVINDRARHVKVRGKQVIVPLKFDEDGNPATLDRLVLKRLSLTDLRFLQTLRQTNWDIGKAGAAVGFTNEQATRRFKRIACFREEDARVKALCEVPTPDWLKAKHVENIYNGGEINDSQHKSYSELAKIEGAYKQTAPTNQLNVFNVTLTPEQEAKLKPVFDAIAEETHVSA